MGRVATCFSLPSRKPSTTLSFLGDDFGKVYGDILRMDAPARGVARVMSDQRAVHHGFGGRAAGVDAGAAEETFLDEGDAPAEVGESVRERSAGLSRTDDDGVVFQGALLLADVGRKNNKKM